MSQDIKRKSRNELLGLAEAFVSRTNGWRGMSAAIPPKRPYAGETPTICIEVNGTGISYTIALNHAANSMRISNGTPEPTVYSLKEATLVDIERTLVLDLTTKMATRDSDPRNRLGL